MLTVKQAAEVLGISPSTVYGIAAPAGQLPCYRVGRAVRFEMSDIEEYKQSCRCAPLNPESVGSSRLVALSPSSGLRDIFLKAGLAHKSKPTPNKEFT
jgi:excisionase family DNA binding protein